MIDLLLYIVTNLFRIFLSDRFLSFFCGAPPIDKKRKAIVFWGYFFSNSLLYLVFHVAWINLLSNLVGMVLLVSLYTKSKKMNLFLTSFIYCLAVMSELFCILINTTYQDGVMVSQIYMVETIFMFFICEQIAERILTFRRGDDSVYSPMLLLIPVSSLGLVVWLIYSESLQGKNIAILSLCLLCINFFMLYLYNITINALTQKYEHALLEQLCGSYRNQLQLIGESEQKVRIFRHDMKHHLNELRFMLQRKKYTEMEQYMERMEYFLENSEEIVKSGNLEIDSLTNYLLKQAKEKLKHVEVNVQIPEDIKHSFDINMVLGNLLENAIEAALQTEEKFLAFDMKWRKGILKIEMSNSFSHSLIVKTVGEDIRLLSTKSDSIYHGIGLQSVKRIVDKYQGDMTFDTEGNRFQVKIILYME